MNESILNQIIKYLNDNNINDNLVNESILKLKELDERYLVETQNRLNILNEIQHTITILYKKMPLINEYLFKIEQFYAYRDTYIDNYDKVMNLILNLANKEDDNYVMKLVYAKELLNPNDPESMAHGKTLIITDKHMEPAFNKQIYRSEELGRLIKSTIDDKYSVVLITQNFCDGRVKPKESLFDGISYHKIRNSGFAGDISCYLYNDDLAKAVNYLIKYIEEYGPDFINIDLDTLYKMVLEYINNSKTLNRRF